MINHLWQSTVFAVAIGLLALALQKNRASIRHSLWLAASIKFLIPLTFIMSLGRQVQPAAPQLARPFATAAEQLTTPFPEPITFTATTQQHFDWTPYIAAIWALGFLAIAITRLRAWFHIRALIRTSEPSPLALPIETRSTTGRLGPGVVGIWNPVLLLPSGLEHQLTPEQFDSVIAHELTHVRRRDNLYATVHMCVEAIFWFHPLIWWIGQRLVEERELACDEAVLAQGGNPSADAEAILGVCKHYVESPLVLVSGVTRADIKKRLEAILNPRNILGLAWSQKILITAAGIAAGMIPFLAGIAAAQSSKGFEVASIRRVDASQQLKGTPTAGGARPSLGDGRLTFSSFVYNLIIQALQVPGCSGVMGDECQRVVGGPDWIRKESYVIQATLPAGTPEYTLLQFIEGRSTEIYPMLESLLRERFALKFHRETRQLPAFTLTVGRNGHKLKPTQAKEVTLSDGTKQLQRSFSFMPFTAANGQRMLHLTVINRSMPDVAESLSHILGRPVVDRTGLTGTFDFEMEYAADTDNLRPTPKLDGPELFTAFQEQAGLRLESTRAPIEVVVIDSIERPSEN